VVRERGEQRCCGELNANTGLHTGNSEPDMYVTCDATEFLYLIWKVNVVEYNPTI
jgi:ATP-dependent phosphoenolpyruvate carboxykinase